MELICEIIAFDLLKRKYILHAFNALVGCILYRISSSEMGG